MGEFVKHNSDGSPYFAYDGNMGVIVATPDNTTIYTHNYEHRGLDHIYSSMRDDGPSTTGAFLFRVAMIDTVDMFDGILAELRAEGYQEIIADQPDESDVRVFQMFMDANFSFRAKNKKIHRWLEDA